MGLHAYTTYVEMIFVHFIVGLKVTHLCKADNDDIGFHDGIMIMMMIMMIMMMMMMVVVVVL